MESLSSNQINSENQTNNLIKYYCYICERKITENPKLNINGDLDLKKANLNSCKFCDSDFIEILGDNDDFKPGQIGYYSNNDEQAYRIEQPPHRMIKKKIQLPNNSPFVKDVLMEVFPMVFRRATLNRIQTIRNLLSTFNQMGQEESATGPTDLDYIKKLEQTTFKGLKPQAYQKCPICTDNFKDQDKVISLECSHIFHGYCLLPWLNLNNSCPNCRFMMPKRKDSFGN